MGADFSKMTKEELFTLLIQPVKVVDRHDHIHYSSQRIKVTELFYKAIPWYHIQSRPDLISPLAFYIHEHYKQDVIDFYLARRRVLGWAYEAYKT